MTAALNVPVERACALGALSSLASGMRFGPNDRFQIVDELGRGGTSVVFLVEDYELCQVRAAKFLAPLDGEGFERVSERARLEARALSCLDHRNVVRLYDVGSCRGFPYLLMEFSDGVSLQELVDKGPLCVSQSLNIAIQVAEALEHAHERGVLHLDLKPGNLWLPREGGLKLIDFGIGACLRDGQAEASGEPLIVGGTPAYMAPEQWTGAARDGRTDLFTLGVVLYEMLTGELPFDECDPLPYQSMLAVRERSRLEARFAPQPGLAALLARALEPIPARRFQSAIELLHALRGLERKVRADAASHGRVEPNRLVEPTRQVLASHLRANASRRACRAQAGRRG